MTVEEVIEKYRKLAEECKRQYQLQVENFNKLKTYELIDDYYEENRGFTGNSVRYKVLEKGTVLKCIGDYTTKYLWCGCQYGSRHYYISKHILKEL